MKKEKARETMQTVNFNAIEKLDFRTKESYKNTEDESGIFWKGQKGDFCYQLYTE